MLTPYNYSFLKDNLTCQFTTKNEIIYQVQFVEDYSLNNLSGANHFDNVYQIVIDKTTDIKAPFDSRVFLTIEAIIIEFFNDTEKVLSFVCDTSDGKQLARFKKFNRWHETSKQNKNIVKLNDDYADTDFELFYSIMVHKNNSKFNHLENAFFSVKEILISEKP